jgi:hypothetical protein
VFDIPYDEAPLLRHIQAWLRNHTGGALPMGPGLDGQMQYFVPMPAPVNIVGGVEAGAIVNDLLAAPRVGSALTVDVAKSELLGFANYGRSAVAEFGASPLAHGFPNIVDNYAGMATTFDLGRGATLYQLEGSFSGVAGRFEWIIQDGAMTHRMFVGGGTVNGYPIIP